MVDIRPNVLPAAILPLRSGDALIVDQGADGVRQTDPFSMTDSVAPVASQAEAVAGADNTKRMTSLRTKQSIASEVGVTLASNSQGAKADSAVQSVNGKMGNTVTITKADVGLGNVDNTSDADKPISTATQTALNLKADDSVVVKSVNGVTPVSGNVTVAAEEKRLQDTRTTAIAESFAGNVQFVETAGYSSVGDGGGALYKRVSSEPSHIAKFQSADGTWWELSENLPDMKMFGARGDGTTNDSPSFQGAYNYAKYKTGASITLTDTDSYYRLMETVVIDNTVNFSLMGVGRPLIMDMSTNGSNTFQIGNGTHTQNQTFISNVRIWGPENPQNGNCLNCSYAGSLRLDKVNIFRHKGLGIFANNCWTVSGSDCSFVDCMGGGAYLTGASGNGSIWSDCTFNGAPTGKFGFFIEGTAGEIPDGPHFGTTLIGCRFEFNAHTGLRAIHCHALNVIGCYFEYNSVNSIRVETGCKGVNLHGNSIFTSVALVINADCVDIRGNCCEWNSNFEVGDSINVSWGPNYTTNKPNIIFGTTPNREYEAFPSWVSFNSTWISTGAQPSLGNGSLLFKYKRVGNTVNCSMELTMGSTTTYGGIGYSFRLPFNSSTGVSFLGKAGYFDASANLEAYTLSAKISPSANYVSIQNSSGSNTSPTSPITFASGDKIYASFTYECV